MRRMWGVSLPALLCGAVLLSRPVPAVAVLVQPAHVESGSVIVTTETAEVREGPSASNEVLTIVGRGEIFVKEGRTGAWYLIKINDDTSGWISGRAVRRYTEGGAEGSVDPEESEESPPTVLGPYDPYEGGYYPYNPYWGSYYDYSFYSWGLPYLSWDWYLFGREPYRARSWYRYRDRNRSWDRDRDRDDGRSRGDGWRRRDDRGNRSNSPSRPHVPRIRLPFPHR